MKAHLRPPQLLLQFPLLFLGLSSVQGQLMLLRGGGPGRRACHQCPVVASGSPTGRSGDPSDALPDVRAPVPSDARPAPLACARIALTCALPAVCRSCLVKYLEENNTCPTCRIVIHQSHPLQYIG